MDLWPVLNGFMFYSVTENEPYGNILLFYVLIDKMCDVLIANVCPHITKKNISACSSKVWCLGQCHGFQRLKSGRKTAKLVL